MAIVNVPSPCPERVSTMEKSGNGFYCESCSHVVTDFTNKTDAEILSYLNERKGQRTCGFFRNEQIIRRSNWPFDMLRFVAALVITFGGLLFVSSCGTTGESVERKSQDSTKAADSIAKANDFHGTVGVVMCPPPPIHDSGKLDSNSTMGFTEPEIEESSK